MDAPAVIRELREKGFLITPEVHGLLEKSENPEELARIALENSNGRRVLEPNDFAAREHTKIREPEPEQVTVVRTDFRPFAKEVEPDLKIPDDGGSLSTGSIDDFYAYFRDRFVRIAEMLRRRGSNDFTDIEGARKRGEKCRIIAMVDERRLSKNGHLLLRVDDLGSSITALIPASNPKLIAEGNQLVSDEVVALHGRCPKDLFIVDEIMQPEMPIKETKTAGEPVLLAALSDIHIGSKLFMKKNFEKFLSWLNGNVGDEKQREAAGRVKYITIAGDVVDGIGVYPTQEEELEITDIYEQYAAFGRYLEQIPEYVEVIIAPGNHDAVRSADPQPPLPKELLPGQHGMKNLHFVGSPASISLHGIGTLVYHGTSFDDVIKYVNGTSYDRIDKVMEEVLRRRHLHPIYGGKPIIPESRDRLVIAEVPDIFHTGHVHRNSYSPYRGILCIGSGTWQSTTPYQLKQGHIPTPCILPLVDLAAAKISVLHFDRMM